MKALLAIFVYAIMLCNAFAQEMVQISINTNANDCMIFIDEKYIGDLSAAIEVEEGVHEIAIYERERGWDSQVIVDTITVTKSDSNNIFTYEFAKRVILNTMPEDAKVYFNNILLGHTPLLLNDENIYLALKKKNYKPIGNINFTPLIETPIKLQFTGEEIEEEFTESVYFKVLIGTAVALGAATAYLKIQADQKFDEFTNTRNKKTLDEVDRYDLYSGISLGLLQINIGYLIYRFVFD